MQAGEDFSEQDVVAWRWSQDELSGVVDHAGGDADESVPQGRDHGPPAAFAVAGQRPVWSLGGGELVEPAGHGRGQQRPPHPCGVDFFVARGQMAKRGAVFPVSYPSPRVSPCCEAVFSAFVQLRG